MSGIATAIAGSAVLGYLGTQQAASTQASAANQANQTQWNMYNQNQANLSPWMGYGQQAGGQLNYLMGLGPQTGTGANTAQGAYGSLATPFSQTNWQADPGYAFRLQQGQQALERSEIGRAHV